MSQLVCVKFMAVSEMVGTMATPHDMMAMSFKRCGPKTATLE